MNRFLLNAFFCFLSLGLHAQMWNGQDTLYGNEWIDYSKTYYRIKTTEDAIYRIDYQTLQSSGFPVDAAPASTWRLFHNGVQESVFTTTEALFGASDFLEFYGRQNRGEVDTYLFDDVNAEQINPRYSMFNDSSAYYLVVDPGVPAERFGSLPNDLSNLPAVEPFCWQTSEKVFFDGIFRRRVTDEIMNSWFDGVGYTRSTGSSNTAVAFDLSKAYLNGPDARLHLRFCGSLDEHQQHFTVNDSLFAVDEFYDFKLIDHVFTVGNALLKPTTNIQFTSPISDRIGLAVADFYYPRLFEFNNIPFTSFDLEAGLADKYLEIKGFNAGSGAPVLWDFGRKTRMTTNVDAGLVKAKVPGDAAVRTFVLVSPSAVKNVSKIQGVQFKDYSTEPADYLIISNPALYSDPKAGGANHVQEYADYRRSAAGGNHAVQVVDIDELYEQFAYGVRFHPISIRNFLHWAKKRWPQCEHVFILGKGYDFVQFRSSSQQNTYIDSLFFVPTFSNPGADQPFVMSGNHLSDPIMAIGRLAVMHPFEIRDYLDKVIQQEQALALAGQNIAEKAWMKRVIHNSGGKSGEIGLIKNFISGMAETLKNNRFGADIHTFYKTSDDPVQLSAYQQVLDLINGGVAMWTIYGHSSAFTVDFDIGQPSVYNNYGKYPLMVIMGCFSGQCSLNQPSIGERFTLAPDRGAIAYIASVNYSSIDALFSYGQQLYTHMGGDGYGKSVGQALQHSIGSLKDTPIPALVALLHQNLLQGDPAIRLYPHEGPDYLVDSQSVQCSPNPVGLERGTAKLQFDAVNLGENPGGELALKIEQRLPDNTSIIRVVDTILAPPNRSTLEYNLPLDSSKAGFNRFLITLDPSNQISETPAAAELNNELLDASGKPGYEVFFYSDDITPVAPDPYAIVSKPKVTLSASTLNTAALPLRYLFELDTTEKFNSPFKQSYATVARGGLLQWTPNLTLKDSSVYYWRVARDSLVNGLPLWRQRSFIYLDQSAPGWNQSHSGQYAEDQLNNLKLTDSTQMLAFKDNAAFLTVQVAYRGVNRYPGIQNSFYENFLGDFGFNQIGVARGVFIILADPNSGRMVHNPPGGPYNYDPQVNRVYFWFDTRDSLQRLKLMDFLQNGIPDGYYAGLLAFNTPSDAAGYAPKLWAVDSISQGKNLFQVLEAIGAKRIRNTVNYTTAPPAYGLVFRKNDPNYPVKDSIVNDPTQVVDVRANFQAKWSAGYLETPPIGPVKSWKSIHWKRGAFDDPSDQASLYVYALRAGQPDTLLFRLDNTFDTSLLALPASGFPQLKLRYEVSDTFARTATGLNYARVLYEGIPEGALHPAAHLSFQRDTLQQGEKLLASIAFANVSDAPFDTLLFRYKIENQSGTGMEFFKKLKPLAPGDTLHAAFSAPTLPLAPGKQRLILEANPEIATGQPEQQHFNNVLVKDFYVVADRRNPLLDVTFDGQHILDGDLISPQPEVIMSLKDENPYIAMTDTSTFSLTLVLPDGKQQNLHFSDPSIQFFPADASSLPKKNQAKLEWRPSFTQDGEYRLLVHARDASGNASAVLDWSARFKVITKSSLSNILNYPNPFSTNTCFVYTLTGLESPVHFKIQIMTVSGRVIREITEQEFGALKPGTHRSDFCWDGRDEYGDQLANGVYLYRIVAKKADGSDFELFENDSVDGYFQKGFGKMVLMR